MKSGQLIGFANTFYTLWDYNIETTYVTDSYGKHHPSGKVTHYYFRKNVSTDIEKVKRMHPDLSIDESLRGKTRSWDCVGRVELPSNIFWFGKYYGKNIDEILISDMGYCEWVVNNHSSRQSEYIKSHPIYIQHISEIEAERQATLNSMNPLKVGDEVELEFITNGFLTTKKHPNELNMTIDEYGNWEVSDESKQCVAKATKDNTDIVFYVSVPDFKRVWGRFPYIMPSMNGKCQKTKGKRFMVKVIEVSEPYMDKWNNITQSVKIA